MALPTGSMTDTDFPYAITATSPAIEYIYFCYRTPLDVKHWSDTEATTEIKAECWTETDVGASTDLLLDISGRGNIVNAFTDNTTISGAVSDQWTDHGVSVEPLDQGQTIPLDLSDSSTHPKGAVGQIVMEKDGSNTAAIHSVCIMMWHDQAYDGERAEYQPRGGSNTLYYKNRFCSSYDMVFGLCETMNKITYESRQIVSFIP